MLEMLKEVNKIKNKFYFIQIMIFIFLKKKRDAPQQRLERVWTLLRMSDNAKLDMAIKYCTSAYADKLMEVNFEPIFF